MNRHVHTDGCFSEGAQVCGMNWPVPAQQAGASLNGPAERATKVKTWRERIGAGPDFPLHAPNDVERAMVAEIAELRRRIECAAPFAPDADPEKDFSDWMERRGALGAGAVPERIFFAGHSAGRRAAMAAASKPPGGLQALIADDAHAATFQSIGQYRSALLKALAGQAAAAHMGAAS